MNAGATRKIVLTTPTRSTRAVGWHCRRCHQRTEIRLPRGGAACTGAGHPFFRSAREEASGPACTTTGGGGECRKLTRGGGLERRRAPTEGMACTGAEHPFFRYAREESRRRAAAGVLLCVMGGQARGGGGTTAGRRAGTAQARVGGLKCKKTKNSPQFILSYQ
jgi:hypothetical protein